MSTTQNKSQELPDILVQLYDTKKTNEVVNEQEGEVPLLEVEMIKAPVEYVEQPKQVEQVQQVQQPKRRGRPPKVVVNTNDDKKQKRAGNVLDNVEVVEPSGKVKVICDWLLELHLDKNGDTYLTNVLSGNPSVRQISELSGVSQPTVYKFVKNIEGYIPYITKILRSKNLTINDYNKQNIILK